MQGLWEALHTALSLLVLFPLPRVPSPSCSLSKLALQKAKQHHPGAAHLTSVPHGTHHGV